MTEGQAQEQPSEPSPAESPAAANSASGGSEARPQDNAAQRQSAEPTSAEPSWEAELAVYPLRPAGDDPSWARRVVRAWVGFALFSIAFITWWLIYGWFYH